MYCDIHTHNVNPRFPSLIDVSGNVDFGVLECGKGNNAFSIGVHPRELDQWIEKCGMISRLAAQGNIQAIGECGLDVFSRFDTSEQYEALITQLQLAKLYQLPVILHCVRLYSTIIRALKAVRISTPVVFHAYNGNIQETRQLLRFPNVYFSFGAVGSDKQRASIAEIPPERILTESDTAVDPDMGQVVDVLSDLKKMDMEQRIFDNFCDIIPR